MADVGIITKCEGVLAGLDTTRYSWWTHWAELAQYILPRRYIWLVTPNKYNRGTAINQSILDATGTIAARTCASGMMSGITSPTRPWFKLRIEGYDPDDPNEVTLWLAEVEKRMMRVFSESNFYNSMAVVYFDLVVFGTAVSLIYEDFDDVIRCYNPCLGEYYLANGPKLKVDTVYRKFTYTVSQVVAEFGIENCSENVKQLYETGGAGLTTEIVVAHALWPNDGSVKGLNKDFRYVEIYWEYGNAQTASNGTQPDVFLRKRGFHDFPALCPRWDTQGNDAYGRGPGMDALGDIKQLQQETRRKGQAIDKMVNPPMVADVQLKNQPASLLPGGVTFVNGQNNAGFKPAYEVQPRIQEMMMDIQEIQRRIQHIFLNNIFMMFENLEAEPRSAAAADFRREEKMVMLGPVLERFHNEALDPAIDRVFGILYRGGLLPEAPAEIAGAPIQVNYVSMLSDAQQAVATSGMERWIATIGNMAAQKPEILDKINVDEFADKYAALLNVDPTLINSDKAVKTIRDTRQKAIESQQAAVLTREAVDGAKVLSDTQVGGGQNALEAMTGLGGQL